MARSAKSLCSSVCGGRCCKFGVVGLTEEEATRLRGLADARHRTQPTIIRTEVGGSTSWAMNVQPCVFLNDSNLCTIYLDRPANCRAFPTTWREDCLLSLTMYGDVAEPPPSHRKARTKEGRSAR